MLLSLRAYAKHRGVSLTAVQKAIKSGRVTTTADGKIDPSIADNQWKSRTEPAKQGRKPKAKVKTETEAAPRVEADREPETDGGAEPEASPDDYWKSRAAREYWESELSRLKAGREKGNLIVREAAEKAWGGMVVATRTKALYLPAQLANRLAAESDPIEVEQILKDAIYRLLSELSEYQPD
jgi:hypothetical protein